jgi:hypothetical protein
MYLVAWFFVGFILASAAMSVTRRWRSTRDTSSEQRSLFVTALAVALLVSGAVRSARSNARPLALDEEIAATDADGLAHFLKAVSLVIAGLLLVWFAVVSDRAAFWECVLWVRSLFLGYRFQALFWGAVCGIIAQLFRTQIVGMSRQAFDAAIGSKEGTAWVLQATLGILIIVAAAFAIKPDLLTYLRSLEYGGFKATFADRATTIRVADLNYKELLWGFTLRYYKDFESDYVGKDSERARFGNFFFPDNANEERKSVTVALLPYAVPVITSLVCLEKNHPIKVAASDSGLIKYGARWVKFLLDVKSDPSGVTFDQVLEFLGDAKKFARETTTYVNSIVSTCKALPVIADEIGDAATILVSYESALQKLRASGKTNSSFQALAIIDPYLIAAAGDLIVVLNGEKEKAEFLAKMLDEFPRSIEMMTSAVVNIFYQLADAQLKSPDSWPVQTILANTDFAIKSIDLLILKTSDLLATQAKTSGAESPNASLAKIPAVEVPDAKQTEKFFDIVNRNLAILLAQKLGLYNQRALAGEAVTQASREDWLRTYSRMIANLSARSDAPILAMDNLPPATVNDRSRSRWPSVGIPPEYLVYVDLSTAFSSILLDQSQGNVSALSCNTALYYLKRASSNVEGFIREETKIAQSDLKAGGARDAISRVSLKELNLKRILAIISNWAGGTCDWKREVD